MTTRRVILILVALTLVLAATASVAVAAPQASYSCVAYHTVKFGDTLNSISRMYGVSVQALMAANDIYNPNLIYAGQTLCIPGSAPVPPRPALRHVLHRAVGRHAEQHRRPLWHDDAGDHVRQQHRQPQLHLRRHDPVHPLRH